MDTRVLKAVGARESDALGKLDFPIAQDFELYAVGVELCAADGVLVEGGITLV